MSEVRRSLAESITAMVTNKGCGQEGALQRYILTEKRIALVYDVIRFSLKTNGVIAHVLCNTRMWTHKSVGPNEYSSDVNH